MPRESGEVTRGLYDPEQDGTLTDAVLDTIERHRGPEFRRTDYDLFEDLDFRALDELFHEHASPSTRLSLQSGNVIIDLWGDRGVQIRVVDAGLD